MLVLWKLISMVILMMIWVCLQINAFAKWREVLKWGVNAKGFA